MKSAYWKTYYANNRAKAIESARKWSAKNAERVKHNQYMHKYGISYSTFLSMVEEQQNKCAICLNPESKLDRKGNPLPLSVDHCHVSNKIRGLLCDNCNKGLGFFKDSEHTLLTAIDYLKKEIA